VVTLLTYSYLGYSYYGTIPALWCAVLMLIYLITVSQNAGKGADVEEEVRV
jgi:hypothetical protein